MIATRIGVSVGTVGQNDQALSASRYHSFAANGSVSVNEWRANAAGTISSATASAASQTLLMRRQPAARDPAPGRRRERSGHGRCRAAACPANDHVPPVPVTVDDTVVHVVPLCNCSSTAAPATAGSTLPATAPPDSAAVTTGETAILARPTRTFPHASRYWVLSAGDSLTENAPVESSVTAPAGVQPVPIALRLQRDAGRRDVVGGMHEAGERHRAAEGNGLRARQEREHRRGEPRRRQVERSSGPGRRSPSPAPRRDRSR